MPALVVRGGHNSQPTGQDASCEPVRRICAEALCQLRASDALQGLQASCQQHFPGPEAFGTNGPASALAAGIGWDWLEAVSLHAAGAYCVAANVYLQHSEQLQTSAVGQPALQSLQALVRRGLQECYAAVGDTQGLQARHPLLTSFVTQGLGCDSGAWV